MSFRYTSPSFISSLDLSVDLHRDRRQGLCPSLLLIQRISIEGSDNFFRHDTFGQGGEVWTWSNGSLTGWGDGFDTGTCSIRASARCGTSDGRVGSELGHLMVGRVDATADFFTMVVEQILSSDHVFPGLTYFDLLGVLVDITVVFIIRECVVTHEFHFCKEFLPSLVFTRNHSVL